VDFLKPFMTFFKTFLDFFLSIQPTVQNKKVLSGPGPLLYIYKIVSGGELDSSQEEPTSRPFICYVFSSIDSACLSDLARNFKTEPTETGALCFG
jgi:hypothetical protein